MNDRLAGLTREEKLAVLAEMASKKAAQPRSYRLSFAQERLWFLHQLDPESFAHSLFRPFELKGELDEGALRAAFRSLVRRHGALRTTFVASGGQGDEAGPRQVVAPPASAEQFEIAFEDLGGLGAEDRETALRDAVHGEPRKAFDLEKGPLLRVRVLRLAPGRAALLLTLHHIVADGWSVGLLYRELAALYEAAREGREAELPELPIQYSDFSRWQREELDLDAQLDFWRCELEGVPTILELPADRPRPALASLAGSLVPFTLDRELSDALREVGQNDGATIFMTLTAAFEVLLFKVTGQRDFVLGTPIANRQRTELEGLVGSFANTLVLRSDLCSEDAGSDAAGGGTFRDLLRRVRRRALHAYDHQDVPFERLVEEVHPQRDLSRNPLFQVMFALLDKAGGGRLRKLGDLDLEPLSVERGLSKVDLTLEVFAGEEIGGYFEYSTDLFDAATIERLSRHFHHLLRAVAENPELPVSEIPLMDAAETRAAVSGWNDTAVPCDLERPLHRRLAERAAETPDATAVVAAPHFEGGTTEGGAAAGAAASLTFRELHERARRLGCHLHHLGVRRGARVGVVMERSPEAMVAFLGVAEAGAAWVALDPSLPTERLAYVVADAGLEVLLTQERLLERLPPVREIVVLDRDELGGLPVELPKVGPDDLAYVIYTSGSTGRPKGVGIPHRAVVHHARAIIAEYELTAADRVLQFASLSFDIAVEEIFPTWLAGATLVLRHERQSLAFADFFRMVEEEGVTMANLPTPYWHEWVSELASGGHLPPALRLVVVGTEQALPERLRTWLATVGERPAWVNAYGPSETTVTATAWRADAAVEAADVVHAPIGWPVANVRAYVVDAFLRPTPTGVPGELLLGGAGLARGYLDRPRLTAAAFVPDPFSGDAGSRLYRTGDLVRRLGDGALLFLGRIDSQVKIRGYRIELGEVEAVLAEHPGVREVVVTAPEVGPGERRLAAWAVAEDGAGLTPAVLREHAARELPAYMVPAALAVLDVLPRTRSGKIDRRALPEPSWGTAGAEAGKAPRSPQEEVLAGVWEDVLGREDVGIHDDFFELGGHSLLAARMLSRLRTVLGAELPLRAVFEAPTVAQLAQRLGDERRGSAPPPILPVPRRPEMPLSFAQQRMWFLHQLDAENPAYNMPAALEIAGRLDTAVLGRALAAVCERHESLRSTFPASRGEPRQHFPTDLAAELTIVELGAAAEGEIEQRALDKAREESLRVFDLAQGPLLRCVLLRLADDLHWLVFTFHHIVSDGRSTDIFLRELILLYHAFLRGEEDPLPGLPVQYADYAVWQRDWLRGEVLEAETAFWRSRLEGAPTLLDLPTDRPRPALRRGQGGRSHFHVSDATCTALKAIGRRQGGSAFMTFLAVFAVLLRRVSHQPDLLIGTPVSGRHHSETEGVIGLFVNTLVLRATFTPRLALVDLLDQVRDTVLEAYAHQDLPFESLVDELDVPRDLSHTPLFQVLFVLHHAAPILRGVDTDLVFRLPSIDNKTSRFDLNLVLVEQAEGLRGFLEYDVDIFDAVTVERLAGCFEELLDAAARSAEEAVDHLPLLTASQRRELLDLPNDTAVAYAESGATLPELFAETARRHPERPAVRCAGEELSYGELAGRIERLARRLRRLGVREDRLVGIAMERSLDLVTAIWAVVTAGGAYVPFDPGYPESRLAFMIDDSGVELVLTQEHLVDVLPLPDSRAVRLLAVDGGEGVDGEAGGALPRPDDLQLAYMIYTSGSTGQPKGAMNSHGAIRNRLLWMQAEYGLDAEDRVLQKTPFSFDVSVWEFFWPLITGATLVVARPGGHQDPDYLVDLVVRENVTTLHFVPSMLQVFLAASGVGRTASSLRRVIVSGEALPADLARRFDELFDGPRLHNLYGPTEAAVDVTYHPCQPGAAYRSGVPIGRPVANTAIYLLDRYLEPVPAGVSGELMIAGVQLARGYHGRPALTAQRFVPDPWSARPGTRMYHSGDLVRYLPDGSIAFLGRLDHQVKIRGFRIELGEVETVLATQPDVRECLVMAREVTPGDLRLVAYLTCTEKASDSGDQVRRWRSAMGAALPEYMVPAFFVVLDALPLSPNGKVDRRRLPAPQVDRSAVAAEYVAPRNEIEERLQAIWKEVLHAERVGVEDKFFDLGGHSLLATLVVARCSEAFDIDMPLRALFEKPTIAALAEEVVVREASQVDNDLLAALLDELE